MQSNERFEVLLEDLHSKMDGVVEGVIALSQSVTILRQDVGNLTEDMSEVKFDAHIIKGVVREHSADLAELKSKAHVH